MNKPLKKYSLTIYYTFISIIMEEKCCICLNILHDKGKVTFDCGHSIHLCCFMNCLKNDTIFCPMCREKIKQNINYYNFLNLKLNKLMENLFKNIKIEVTETKNESHINIEINDS